MGSSGINAVHGDTSDLIRFDIQNIQDEIRNRSLHAFRCCFSLQSLPHHRMQRANFRNPGQKKSDSDSDSKCFKVEPKPFTPVKCSAPVLMTKQEFLAAIAQCK